MQIAYVTRSKFLNVYSDAISAHSDTLNNGGTLEIQSGAGGYAGRVEVELTPTRPDGFTAFWNGADPTRFPARIRAAATALKDCGFMGRFLITHKQGTISICKSIALRSVQETY